MKIRLADWLTISIHKSGVNFCAILFGLFLVSLAATGLHSITLLIMILLTFSLYFFRNPDRVTPNEKNIVTSPADGKIINIQEATLPSELNSDDSKQYQKISIFLNIDNVHVQRAPLDAIVEKVHYIHGTFINASLDKASSNNERNIVLFKSRATNDILCCVQISGFIARRIVCDVATGNEVKIGDMYGIIKFGSRVELYVPAHYNLAVSVGQTMIAGETIIARF